MMKSFCSGFILFSGLIGICTSILTVEAYKAAVVAYKPLYQNDWLPDEIVKENVDACDKKIRDAKGKTEIIVFPEYGFTTVDVKEKVKEHLSDYSMVINEKIGIPCDNEKESDPNLFKLSCASKTARVYAVFNAIESYQKSYYLTTVVLDAEGNITVKCRRNYVPTKSGFSNNEKRQPCIFTAKFKSETKFLVLQEPGLLGSMPSGVDNVILTSAMENSVPFKYAPGFHAGFAVRNKVNLLVAGYFDVDLRYGGTGIYNIDNDRLIANATFGTNAATEDVLYKEVKESVKKDVIVQVEVGLKTQSSMNIPFSNLTGAKNNNTEYHECIRGYCCDFKAETDQKSIYPYEWLVFHNKTTMFGRDVEIVHCALIKPGEVNAATFINVTISSTYPKGEVAQVLPIAVKNNFKIPVYVYKETDSVRSLYLTQKEELISFGIIHVLSGSASKMGVLAPSCLLVILLLWLVN